MRNFSAYPFLCTKKALLWLENITNHYPGAAAIPIFRKSGSTLNFARNSRLTFFELANWRINEFRPARNFGNCSASTSPAVARIRLVAGRLALGSKFSAARSEHLRACRVKALHAHENGAAGLFISLSGTAGLQCVSRLL